MFASVFSFFILLVLYQIFANKPYFDRTDIESENYLQTLIADDFVADLSAVHHKGVTKFLKEMLHRKPIHRKSFDEILKHRVFTAASSISTSRLATKAGLKQIESKINTLLSMQQRLLTNSDRTLDMLNDITVNQLVILEELDSGFEDLSHHMSETLNAIGSAMQLMINLEQSDIPILFLCIPTDMNTFSKGFINWVTNIKKNGLKKIGWKKYLTLYVMDEGSILLPDEIEKSDQPAHEGIDFELPGRLMIALAPLLYVFSKLLQIAR